MNDWLNNLVMGKYIDKTSRSYLRTTRFICLYILFTCLLLQRSRVNPLFDQV